MPEIENQPPEVEDFTQIVNDSKQQLAGQDFTETEAKRGRGRPAGSKNKSNGLGPAPAAPYVPPGPSPMVPTLAVMAKVPFDIWAQKSKCDEVRLDNEEALGIATQVDQVISLWLPEMASANPKTTALVMCCLSIGMITFAKYGAYAEFLKTTDPADQSEKRPENNGGPQGSGTRTESGSYFAETKAG